MAIIDESGFRLWLSSQNKWSNKAQNDLVSRLRRAEKIKAIDTSTQEDSYVTALENSAEWAVIPRSSRTGIIAAARLYLGWRRSL